MLSCLCNECPGKLPQPYSSSCRIHEQWERCNTWSCTVWAPTAAAFLQGMPLPLWDGQALLAEEESTTLVNLPFPYNPFLSFLKSPKAYVSLLPSLKLIPLPLLYLTRVEVWFFFFFSFLTFALSNESMSRMFESLVASLSPNPLCTQSLKCYIHALMRDEMDIK